jgi:hypothetical protein
MSLTVQVIGIVTAGPVFQGHSVEGVDFLGGIQVDDNILQSDTPQRKSIQRTSSESVFKTIWVMLARTNRLQRVEKACLHHAKLMWGG